MTMAPDIIAPSTLPAGRLKSDINVKVKEIAETCMRIGALASRTGVSQRLLRYYEEQGMLEPARLPSGYREYSEADVGTVRRIRSLLAAGLTTSVIAQILPCAREETDRLVPVCPELAARLNGERARLTSTITQLQNSRRILDGVLAESES
ncbi:MAG TPA: MerR family transcriptional regulator [Pseudonocardia sp.]|jgi:DNA-binding transcriptional MerR regulator|nr:MerR family transcriptional regulator [Pseudonocardia sp.]